MRLAKKQFKDYCKYLAYKHPECLRCGAEAVEHHHVLYGAYKSDDTLLPICRPCHEWMHKNKRAGQEEFLPTAKKLWEGYCDR